MIINPIIFGGGGTSGTEIYHNVYSTTADLTLKQFLSTYDIRLHYKNSILYILTSVDSGTTLSSANRIKTVIIPNINNFGSDYAVILISATATQLGWYALMRNGTKAYIDHSNFSSDATTGRLSSTTSDTKLLASDGCYVAVWEMPINPENNSNLAIDTTPWGTT